MKTEHLKPRPAPPYRVPDDYFSSLTRRVMDRLPEQPAVPVAVTVPLWRRPLPRIAAAACAAVLVAGAALYGTRMTEQPAVAATETAATPLDQAVDCCMYDNTDIYASLSEY